MNPGSVARQTYPMDMDPKRRAGRVERYVIFYLVLMQAIPFIKLLSGLNIMLFVFIDTIALYSFFVAMGYMARPIRLPAKRYSLLDFFVFLFLGLSLFSGLLFLQKNNPASPLAYLFGLHHLVIPMFLYYCSKSIPADGQANLLKIICMLNLFYIAVGLIMYYWRPEFYSNYLMNWEFHGEITEHWQLFGRLRSYLGSTTVGILSGTTIVLVDFLKIKKFLKHALVVILFIAGLLSQQRGGYAAIIVGVVYYGFLSRKTVSNKTGFLVLGTGLFIALFAVFSIRVGRFEGQINIVEKTRQRLFEETLTAEQISERKAGYIDGWRNIRNFPLGLGIGATLSASDWAGANPGGQVVDANFMRILSDLGIGGLLLFLLLNALALRSSWKKKNRWAWISILLIYNVIALGTNVYDVYYVNHLYWIFLGMMNTFPKKSISLAQKM